jgi:hypothetical protein
MRPPFFVFIKANVWNVSLILLGIAIAFVEFPTISRSESEFIHLLFKSVADSAFSAIEKEFLSSQVYQEMMVNYFLTVNGSVTRESFARFSRPDVLWRVPTMLAIQYSPVVQHADRAAFEAMASSVLGFNYTIGQRVGGINGWTSPPREQYIPMLFSEPFNSSRAVLGLDILFQSPALLRRINDTGVMLASDRIRLAQTGNYGFIKYIPLFRQNGELVLQRARLDSIIGASYDVSLALQAALKGVPLQDIDIFFYNHQPNLMSMYSDPPRNWTALESLSIAGAQQRGKMSMTYSLGVSATQNCTIVINATEEFVRSRLTFTPYLIFVLSLLVSCIDLGHTAYYYFHYDKVMAKVTHVHRKATESKKDLGASTKNVVVGTGNLEEK